MFSKLFNAIRNRFLCRLTQRKGKEAIHSVCNLVDALFTMPSDEALERIASFKAEAAVWRAEDHTQAVNDAQSMVLDIVYEMEAIIGIRATAASEMETHFKCIGERIKETLTKLGRENTPATTE